MKPYPEYKDSGVEWIGEIPNGWTVTRIKYTPDGTENSFIDGDWIESPHIVDEGIRYITTGNIGEGKFKEQGNGHISEETFQLLNCTEVFAGDIVISRLSLPVGRSCIIPNLAKRIVTSVDNVILRANSKYLPKYLVYQFNSKKYFEYTELIARGTTLTRISRTMLGNISIAVPTLTEQTQIANFLDTKTQQINELIQNKEQKIKLLQEKRTAVINQAVTKGLNPDAEMKDSGVEWIGEIPAGWEMIKVKYIFNLITEKAPKNHDMELLSLYTDIGVEPRKNLEQKGNKASTTDEYWIVKEGDIIVNKLLAWMGAIARSSYNGVTSPAYDILRPVVDIDSKFYHHLFRGGLYLTEFKRRSRGIMNMRLRLYFEELGQILVPCPNLDIQTKIVSYLDDKTQQIDDLIGKEQRKIELLKEYRQSLISDAVTGKIDVREAV